MLDVLLPHGLQANSATERYTKPGLWSSRCLLFKTPFCWHVHIYFWFFVHMQLPSPHAFHVAGPPCEPVTPLLSAAARFLRTTTSENAGWCGGLAHMPCTESCAYLLVLRARA